MKTTLNIKNFRVFDEHGVSFEINPITILTGSNSSGKSSVVKAIFLLNSFLSQIKKAIANGNRIELDKYKLDFTQYPNNLLGRFDKVVHAGSASKSITIEYTVYSLMLSKDVNVQLVFSDDKNDELNNAYLDSVTMSTEDGVFYSSGRNEPSFCNLNILKEDYVTFLLAEHSVHEFCDIKATYDVFGEMTKEEYQSGKNKQIEYLRAVETNRLRDILRYVRFSNSKELVEKEDHRSFLEQVAESGHVFSIPLLDELSDLDKKDVRNHIESRYVKDESEGARAASKKVLDAFEKSEFETFADFFYDFEHRYLEHVACGNGVHLLCQDQLSLGNNDLHSYIAAYEYEAVLGRNLKVLNEEERLAEKEEEIQELEQRAISFELLYAIVMEWNLCYEKESEEDVINNNSEKAYVYDMPWWSPVQNVYHIAYQLLTKFAAAVAYEVMTPDWSGNMSYVSSSRVNVNRLYTLEKHDDFSQLLQAYFEKKRLYQDSQKNVENNMKRDYVIDSFMNSWIKRFDIGKSISLDVDIEGLGVQIRLHKAVRDKGRLLADEGYGITQLVSILLQIETAILSAKGLNVNNYYGLEMLDHYDTEQFHYEVNTIAIEEPEIHLHPKFQSLLADMLVEAYEKYNIHFVVETHSEYLIRKVQVLTARKKYKDEKDIAENCLYSIYYIPVDESPYRMIMEPSGKFKKSFGTGFFDEAAKLHMEILYKGK